MISSQEEIISVDHNSGVFISSDQIHGKFKKNATSSQMELVKVHIRTLDEINYLFGGWDQTRHTYSADCSFGLDFYAHGFKIRFDLIN